VGLEPVREALEPTMKSRRTAGRRLQAVHGSAARTRQGLIELIEPRAERHEFGAELDKLLISERDVHLSVTKILVLSLEFRHPSAKLVLQ
jgi:hypothetical protein